MKIEPITFETLFKQNLSSPLFGCAVIALVIMTIIIGIIQYVKSCENNGPIVAFINTSIGSILTACIGIAIPILIAYHEADSTARNYDEHITGTITTKITDTSYANNDNQFIFKSQGHTFKVWDVQANVKKGDKIKVHFDENVEKPKKNKPYDLDGDHLKYEVIKR